MLPSPSAAQNTPFQRWNNFRGAIPWAVKTSPYTVARDLVGSVGILSPDVPSPRGAVAVSLSGGIIWVWFYSLSFWATQIPSSGLTLSIFLPSPASDLAGKPVCSAGVWGQGLLLSVVTFQECCWKKILTNTTEWRGVGGNNPQRSLERAGGTGSGFWLNDLSSLSPLPPDLPLLDHTWWQACQTQLVWCGIILCLSIWKQLSWNIKTLVVPSVYLIFSSWLLVLNAATEGKRNILHLACTFSSCWLFCFISNLEAFSRKQVWIKYLMKAHMVV